MTAIDAASSTTPEPVLPANAVRERVVGYDIARCLAFFGMVIVNYRLVMGGWVGTPEWLLSGMEVVTGRAAATFVVLAGVSMTLFLRARQHKPPASWRWSDPFRSLSLVLMIAVAWLAVDFYATESAARRSVSFGPLAREGRGGEEAAATLSERFTDYLGLLNEGSYSLFLQIGAGVVIVLLGLFLFGGASLRTPRAVLFKRSLFLAALGFAWYPVWGGDILHFYAFYLAAGCLVFTLRASWILVVAVLLLGAAFWWQFVQTDPSAGGGGGMAEAMGNASSEGSRSHRWSLHRVADNLFLSGYHPVLPWLGFLLAGLLVGRMNVGSWLQKTGLLALGLTLAVAGYWGAEPLADWLRGNHGPQVVENHPANLSLVVDEPKEDEESDEESGGSDRERWARWLSSARSNRGGDRNSGRDGGRDGARSERSGGRDGGRDGARSERPGGRDGGRDGARSERPGGRGVAEAGFGRRGARGGAESSGDGLPLAIPDDFDRQANAEFLAGAEKLRTLLGGSGAWGERELSVIEIEDEGGRRDAVVMKLSYGKDKPAPPNYERQMRTLSSAVSRWVRSAERARVRAQTAAKSDPDESAGAEEASPEPGGAQPEPEQAETGQAEDSGGEQSGNEGSATETSGNEGSATEQSGGEESATETSGNEGSATEQSGGEGSATETSGGEESAGEQSAAEASGGEESTGEQSGGAESGSEESGNEASGGAGGRESRGGASRRGGRDRSWSRRGRGDASAGDNGDTNEGDDSDEARIQRWRRQRNQRWPVGVGLFRVDRYMLARDADGNEEQVLWDTHSFDTVAMAKPSAAARWAGMINPHSMRHGPGYMMTATGIALAVIALSLMVASFAFCRRVLKPMVWTGQMALSLYVGHVLVGFGILALIGKLRGEDLSFIAFYIITCWVAAVAFACLWRSHFKRGPLEAVMRWMTG